MANKAQNDWLVKIGVATLNTVVATGAGVVKTAGDTLGTSSAPDSWDASAKPKAPEPPKNKIIEILNSKGSDAQKTQALRKAGYCQFDVEIVATDYRGQPMSGYMLSARFDGAGVDHATTTGKVESGAFIRKGLWAAREGIASVNAQNMDMEKNDVQSPHTRSGVTSYKVPDKDPLKLKILQEYEEVDIGDKESSETGSKYGHETELEVGAEIDLGLGKIGDKGTDKHSSEHEYKTGNERSTSHKRRLPTDSLKVEQIS